MRVGDAWPGSRCGHGAKRKVPKTSAPARQIAPRAGCAFRSSETTPKSPFDPLSVPPPVVDTAAHRQASRRCPFLPPPPNQAKSAHPSHNTTHRRNRSMHSLRTSAPLQRALASRTCWTVPRPSFGRPSTVHCGASAPSLSRRCAVETTAIAPAHPNTLSPLVTPLLSCNRNRISVWAAILAVRP